MFTKREKARTNNVLGGQHLCSLLKNKEYMCTYQRQGFLLSPSAQQTEVCSFVIQICLCSLGLWGRGEWLGDSVPPFQFSSVQFCSVAQSCPTLCDPMNRSTPGLPVNHQLQEFTQTHVHRVGDAIQPSHPLSSPSPPAPNPSQHQGLFQWINSSHEVAKVLEFQL